MGQLSGIGKTVKMAWTIDFYALTTTEIIAEEGTSVCLDLVGSAILLL